MSKIKIETLSSVHIGSGNELQEGQDFVVTGSGEYKDITVIDVNEMGRRIEPRYYDNWVAMINNGKNINEILKRCAPNTSIDDITKYKIEDWANQVKHRDVLKEQIRDGKGLPYIPGSSIKGALRTAILASIADGNPGKINSFNFRNFEKDNFGNINNSVFRFMQVGDAFFEPESVIATRVNSLNIRDSQDDLHDEKISQLLEVIRQGESSTLDLKLDIDRYRISKCQDSSLVAMPDCMQSLGKLFAAVNAYTMQLVQSDIEFWEDQEKTGAEHYVDNLNEIVNEANTCKKGNECILRVGAGSGWRFTTGAWTESHDFFEDEVVPMSRRKYRNYTMYPFPKTRRAEEQDDMLLGFVKLSITE